MKQFCDMIDVCGYFFYGILFLTVVLILIVEYRKIGRGKK